MTTNTITCVDCGACCLQQGSPPGYLFLLSSPPGRKKWPYKQDLSRLANLPKKALAVIHLHHQALLADLTDGDGPCCWLDQKTRRCRWYEHRPQICRYFDAGSNECRSWRDDYHIDVQEIPVESNLGVGREVP